MLAVQNFWGAQPSKIISDFFLSEGLLFYEGSSRRILPATLGASDHYETPPGVARRSTTTPLGAEGETHWREHALQVCPEDYRGNRTNRPVLPSPPRSCPPPSGENSLIESPPTAFSS